MDVLTDDHEREQVVRNWWHENWLSLTVGVVIAIGGMVGYRYYQDHKTTQAQEYAYQMSAIQTKLNLEPTKALEQASSFIKEHEDIYGSLLSLDVAAVQTNEGKYDEALKSVDFAIENGGKLVAPNATLVKAHILTQSQKYDEAVVLLEGLTQDAYAVEKQELLGDIYLLQGKKDLASKAYQEAISICEQKNIAITSVLQIKADSLIADGQTPAFERAIKLEEKIAAQATKIKK